MLTRGKTSLSSLVGIGSRRQVDDLDEEISEVSLWRSIGEKQFKYISGCTAVSKVPKFEDKLVPVDGRR